MDMFYWLWEYVKVFFSYALVMLVWPSVVFCRHLKGKGATYRLGFCVAAQVVILNSVVLSLGLLHILNPWTARLFFYGVFLFRAGQELKSQYARGAYQEVLHLVYCLLMGTCQIKGFLAWGVRKLRCRVKGFLSKIRGGLGLHGVEYVMLLAVLLYGMVYFTYGVFQDYNYGFGDMYVHHGWIQGLTEGKIFSDGVYPEAMHCFIYSMHVFFGVEVYSCLLFLGGIHVAVFLLAAYSFLKEMFEWRYTPIFVLILFLTLDLACIDGVFSMSRLQWTLPQEFGLYTQFFCALFLVRYLKSARQASLSEKTPKGVWNENLLVFALSLSASIATHFYCTILVFFLCASCAVCSLRKLLKRERILPLLTAASLGVLIAVAPMLGALTSGIPFQGSIEWAVNVINGKEFEKEGMEQTGRSAAFWGSGSLVERVGETAAILREDGYAVLYGAERADLLLMLTGVSLTLWAVYRVIRGIRRFFRKNDGGAAYFQSYPPLIAASVLYMAAYAARALGLPQLIYGSRLFTSLHLLLLAVAVMPVDMLFTLLGRFRREWLLQTLSVAVSAGICCGVVLSGSYHGYLYCELTRYNASIQVTNLIIHSLPRWSYTIVSTTEELYQVAQYGRHEELLAFLEGIGGSRYKLPTEHVFIYVEKKPIEYGQSHFFQGPSWLAAEKYADYYHTAVSRCPEISAYMISEEGAQKDIPQYERPFRSYTIPESRAIVESKAYLWCQNFAKVHPFEMNIYYEDEDFVCYYFRQNPFALYDLAIEGWDRTADVSW